MAARPLRRGAHSSPDQSSASGSGMRVHRVPVLHRHLRAARPRFRRVRDTAVGAIAVHRGHLGLGGLNRFGVVHLIAVADVVTDLLQLHEFFAHLGAGDGRVRLGERSDGNNEDSGNSNGLNQGLHGYDLQWVQSGPCPTVCLCMRPMYASYACQTPGLTPKTMEDLSRLRKNHWRYRMSCMGGREARTSGSGRCPP
ncbi:hypothetical protein PSAC2689_20507 [Paraburkholderia sacchari]